MWAIEVKIGWDWITLPERYHNRPSAQAEMDRLTDRYGVGYRLLDTTTGNTFTA